MPIRHTEGNNCAFSKPRGVVHSIDMKTNQPTLHGLHHVTATVNAAPPKLPDAHEANRAYTTYPAEAGNVILFESWLRHEVAANRVDDERISISFNYAWS